MKTNWVWLLLCFTACTCIALECKAQTPAFTPEQEAFMQRKIEEAVAKAMGAQPAKPVDTPQVDRASKQLEVNEQSSGSIRCVLGFVIPGCKSAEDGGRLDVSVKQSAGNSASVMAQGVADGGIDEQDGKHSSDLAPMGIGPAIRSDTLTIAPASRSSAGLHRESPSDPRDSSAPVVRTRSDITFNEDGTTAVIRFDSETNDLLIRQDKIVAASNGWSLQVASPVDEPDRKRANIATLDGFSSGLGMTFEINRQRSDLRAKNPGALRRDLGFFCIAIGLPATCTYEEAWNLATEETDNEVVAATRAKALTAFQRKQFKWIRDYAFRVTTGRERFDYLTPSLEERSEHRVGWGFGATAAFVSPSRRWLYSLAADYQKGGESAETTILCPPSSSAPVTCVEGAYGPPSWTYRKLVSAEVRSNLGPVGYSLKVAHDFESDTTGIDLPIYLLRNASGALTGGIRLGWTDETDVVFGIFLSSPLSLKP